MHGQQGEYWEQQQTDIEKKKKGDGLPGVWGACDNQLCIALSTLGKKKKNFSEDSYSVWYVSKNSLDSAVKKMPTLYTQILLDNIMCFNEMQEFREKEKVCVTEMWKEEKVWNEAGSSQCYNMTF